MGTISKVSLWGVHTSRHQLLYLTEILMDTIIFHIGILAAPTQRQKPSPTLVPVGNVIGVALRQCEHAIISGCDGSTN